MRSPVQGSGRGYAPGLNQYIPVAIALGGGRVVVAYLSPPLALAVITGVIVGPALYRLVKSWLSTVGGEIANLDMLGAETATTEQVRQLGLAPVQRQTMALG